MLSRFEPFDANAIAMIAWGQTHRSQLASSSNHAWQSLTRQAWLLLLASWLLCVWPHAIIAIAFASNGSNRESMQFYSRWSKSSPVGVKVLVSGALLTVWHFSFCIAGFVGTGRRLFKRA